MNRLIPLALAALLAGCASQSQVQLMGRDSGKIYGGLVQSDGYGASILSVTIEGVGYSGPMIRTASSDSYGFIETYSYGRRHSQFGAIQSYGDSTAYKALLTSPDGKGLRCDLSSGGGGQGGGVCVDDQSRSYDLVFKGQ
ncbi:hypothetical protein B9N43_11675 [Denitratisoma sp. DHT3]|uniref:hypothetical protein n=1 Tax=Denitratisoma sp. DHT3 TaxID=1981880 RepID=UPI001198A346|nr:hypothetical protein [Denitratisoma sp. DHT3]QDX81852.1 hypothetical protein B9N43_11675 [Denitratisoma sp. DHT3]